MPRRFFPSVRSSSFHSEHQRLLGSGFSSSMCSIWKVTPIPSNLVSLSVAISTAFSRIRTARMHCFFTEVDPHSSISIFDLTSVRSAALRSNSPRILCPLLMADVIAKMCFMRSVIRGLVVANRSPTLPNTCTCVCVCRCVCARKYVFVYCCN